MSLFDMPKINYFDFEKNKQEQINSVYNVYIVTCIFFLKKRETLVSLTW